MGGKMRKYKLMYHIHNSITEQNAKVHGTLGQSLY